MTTALYARVSTADQDCSRQLAELRDYATRQGWAIREYVDHGWSGKIKDRPELMRLMQDAKRKIIDTVVVCKIDRFGRSLSNLLNNVEDLDRYGVRFIALHQSIDTDKNNPSARLTLQILAAVAQFELTLIQERTKGGLMAAKAKGTVLGRPRKVKDIERILELRAQGYSFARIAGEVGISRTAVDRVLRSGNMAKTAS
jgi:DNA invertase Pin-like site-specific DNA recombinase